MMNDRFSAHLRQHLVDTANERPAEGQLAALLERVEGTSQRSPIASRLAWSGASPVRIGPFPTAAIRLGLVVLALMLATAAFAVLGGGTARPVTGPTLGQTPAAECVDLAAGATYTAPAGPLTVTATIPEAPAIQWQGSPDEFYLQGPCDRPAPISAFASTATEMLATSCLSGSPEVTTFADAVARLDTATGQGISERIDLAIGGHAAARYDVFVLTGCPEGFGLWAGAALGLGETGSLYVVDVDGVLLAIELNRDGTQTETQLEEARAIIASLQISR